MKRFISACYTSVGALCAVATRQAYETVIALVIEKKHNGVFAGLDLHGIATVSIEIACASTVYLDDTQ